MARPTRQIEADGYYHVLNRGNGKMTLFHKPGDYEAFVRILSEGVNRYRVEILAWCLMSNHWHLLLRPREDEVLSDLMRWIGVTHVRRHHEHHRTRGGGHVYQGRFKSFPIQNDLHFLTVARYVEGNPLRAGLVKRAEQWEWSSLGRNESKRPAVPIGRWPVERPENWREVVNELLSASDLGQLRTSVERGRPFGSERWITLAVKRLNLLNSIRGVGRPRKERNQ
jgi:putative transposase